MTKAIAGTVLASHGSVAGLDGRPYEIYHHGVAFTTFLVGQAFHVAALGRTTCVEVLGPNEDLSVWISKKEGADTPAGQRPLQLPITLRRIFGSALMDIIGPVIEPMLSMHQAAKRGGSCGPNVTTAFRHLESLGHQPPAAPSNLWKGILVEAADPCDTVCLGCDDPALARMPAATLADQSKAFVALAWLGWSRSCADGRCPSGSSVLSTVSFLTGGTCHHSREARAV